jgi:CRP-like cAMP-binding protein
MSRALQKVAFLRQTTLFSELPSNDLEALSLRVRERTYRRHETVFHFDDPGTALLLIRTGRVKVTLTSKEGKEIILRIAGPGEIVGEVALLDGHPRSATIVALEKLEVFLLERDALIEFISQHPETALKLLSVLSWTIRRANDRIGTLAFSDAYGKVAQVLLELVKKHGQTTETGIEIDER